MNTRCLTIVLVSLSLFACAVPAEQDASIALEGDTVGESALKLPPTICTKDQGCGAPTGTPPGGACPQRQNQCFGAIGMDCSGAIPGGAGIPNVEGLIEVGCANGSCWINAGSWAHDECCASTPSGRWCGGPLSAFNAGCVASWDRANHRVQHGLNWQRRVNMCRVDADGLVDFAEYCAPGGTIVAAEDANRCCAGSARAFNAVADAGRALGQAVILDGSFTPVVCNASAQSTTTPPPSSGGSSSPPSSGRSSPPPAPRPCLSDAQCRPGEACLQPTGGSAGRKYCFAF